MSLGEQRTARAVCNSPATFSHAHDAFDDEEAWNPYLLQLNNDGHFQEGSAIGDGVCAREV